MVVGLYRWKLDCRLETSIIQLQAPYHLKHGSHSCKTEETNILAEFIHNASTNHPYALLDQDIFDSFNLLGYMQPWWATWPLLLEIFSTSSFVLWLVLCSSLFLISALSCSALTEAIICRETGRQEKTLEQVESIGWHTQTTRTSGSIQWKFA